MTNQRTLIPEAFIDKGFPSGKIFCTQFLNSSEFTLETLKSLVKNGKSKPKYELAENLAESLEKQEISKDKVLSAYVQQPRKWLSFKIGCCKNYPEYSSSEKLLTDFGANGWHGPIKDACNVSKWYIRTYEVPFYEQGVSQSESIQPGGIPEQSSLIAIYRIRWTVVAEIGENHIALSWNGFSHNGIESGSIESLTQFPYWKYIPIFFDELSESCDTQWQHPILHKLVLQDLWDKYLNDSQYIWRHLRIRANNRGVALNVHSTGANDSEERQMRGLQALSKALTSSALLSLKIQETSELTTSVENALLRTLIQEWGAKSYEFSLTKVNSYSNFSPDGEEEEAKHHKEIIRAHFYFSIGTSSSPQDSFQHLRCFTQKYGGSSKALQFLLSELGYLNSPSCDSEFDYL
jgi:hypothetical protein